MPGIAQRPAGGRPRRRRRGERPKPAGRPGRAQRGLHRAGCRPCSRSDRCQPVRRRSDHLGDGRLQPPPRRQRGRRRRDPPARHQRRPSPRIGGHRGQPDHRADCPPLTGPAPGHRSTRRPVRRPRQRCRPRRHRRAGAPRRRRSHGDPEPRSGAGSDQCPLPPSPGGGVVGADHSTGARGAGGSRGRGRRTGAGPRGRKRRT